MALRQNGVTIAIARIHDTRQRLCSEKFHKSSATIVALYQRNKQPPLMTSTFDQQQTPKSDDERCGIKRNLMNAIESWDRLPMRRYFRIRRPYWAVNAIITLCRFPVPINAS